MNEREMVYEEKRVKGAPGMLVLLASLVLFAGSVAGFVLSGIYTFIPGFILCPIALVATFLLWGGLRIVKPNEALVLTLFGKYYGTLRGATFAFVNPFCSAFNPAASSALVAAAEAAAATAADTKTAVRTTPSISKKISLKANTLDNRRQKINDLLGNPIEIGIVVIWRVVNTAKAVFNVDNYMNYLSIQADSALRNIVRLYPYDTAEGGDEQSLRGSAQEVAELLKKEIQEKVEIAGLEIIEARITHLAYAPEIAAAMLQRQQAAAIIDARKMIVDGAVGMVEMALDRLSQNDVVQLDEERKAAMVSNLLVVLCGNKDAQPIVNSGSIY